MFKEIFIILFIIKFFDFVLYKKDKEYYLDENFKNFYKNNFYFKILIDDLIKYNLVFVEKNYNNFVKELVKFFGEYIK